MCGVSTVLGASRNGWSRGQRLDVEHVEPGAGDRARAQRPEQRVLVDDRPARGVDEHGGRLHQRELAGADQPARALGEPQVDAHDVRALEQLFLAHRLDALAAARRSGSRFWLQARRPSRTPGRRARRACRAGRGRAGRACGPASSGPIVCCQPPVADRAVLGDDVAGGGEDQAPGELGRVARAARRSRTRVTPCSRAASMSIDAFAMPVVTSSRRSGSAGQPLGGERRALAHRDHDLEAGEVLGQRGVARDVAVEHVTSALGRERVPVGEVAGDLLVVVEHGDLDGHRIGHPTRESGQLLPARPSSPVGIA